MTMQRMELLAPAGGMEQLKAALRFGADAVYGGLSRHSLRAFAGNFDAAARFRRPCACATRRARASMPRINALATDGELADFVDTAREALEAGRGRGHRGRRGRGGGAAQAGSGPCAAFEHAAERLQRPGGGGAARGHGAPRAWCWAREMRLGGRRGPAPSRALPGTWRWRRSCTGAMCVAYSGRCLLSAALTGRSANRGACAQPCRWRYHLTEEKRPGEYLPVYEDERRHVSVFRGRFVHDRPSGPPAGRGRCQPQDRGSA